MKKKRYDFLAVVITILVVMILVFSEQTRAVHIGLTSRSSETPDEETTVSFVAYVDIDTDEIIPVLNLTLQIGSESCVFDVDGSIISGDLCDDITITKKRDPVYTSADLWGYDYVEMINRTFGYGFGYSFESGVTRSASPYGELSYDIEWTTPSVSADTEYDVSFTARADDTIIYEKTYTNFFTVKKTGSSSSSSPRSPSPIYTDPTTGVEHRRVWIFQQINSGEEAKTNYDTNVMGGLLGISIRFGNTLNNIQVVAAKLYGHPDTEGKNNRKTYSYLEINIPFYSSSVDSAKISFEVDESWLQENGISPEDIVLLRYVNGEWVEIPTRRTGYSNNKYSYEATTPGLSYFAIAEKEQAVIEPEETVEEEVVYVEIDEEVEEIIVPPADVEPEEKQKDNKILFAVIAVLAFLVALGFFIFRMKKREHKSLDHFYNKIKDLEKEREAEPEKKEEVVPAPEPKKEEIKAAPEPKKTETKTAAAPEPKTKVVKKPRKPNTIKKKKK